VRKEVEMEGTDCSNRFSAFSTRFSSYKYPEGFKPIGITKYDGKQAPQQWLRCYSTAIEVARGSNITKVVYFPMALDPAPLTWLESLSNNSIDSWERLKKVFIDNFQGEIARAGTGHDLAQCKQEHNELLWSYKRYFFDVRATITNISEEDIIDCFYNGITNPGIYRDFGQNRPKNVAGLHDMMHDWWWGHQLQYKNIYISSTRSIPGATYTTRRTSTPGPGTIPYTWANYSGPCEGIELYHAIEERRPRRIAVGPTGGPTFATLGVNSTRGYCSTPPLLAAARGCVPYLDRLFFYFQTRVLFYI
jgi:hypothetical protein